MMRRISKRRLYILTAIAAAVLVAVPVVMAFTSYLSVSNSFTVGSQMQAVSLAIAYDPPNPITDPADFLTYSAYTPCSLGTGSSWTCPSPTTNDLSAGDSIVYTFATETPLTSVIPSVTVSAGSFSTFSYATYFASISKLGGLPTSTLQSGLPTLTNGQWFIVFVDISISPNPAVGSATFSVSYGA